MEFCENKKKKAKEKNEERSETRARNVFKSKAHIEIGEQKQNEEEYGLAVNYYCRPPFGNVDLEEAEHMVQERLNLYSILQENSSTVAERLNHAESKWEINSHLGSKIYKKSVNLECRRRDHISHFLLRLYFCRSDELRRMFITLESELLKIRLREQQQFMDKFFEANNLNFETAEASVSQELKKIYFSKENENEKGDIYKIPFEEALDVVKTRRAVLKEGYAYILAADMILIVVQKFQLELSQMLASLNLHLSEFEEDRRLIPLIDNLFQMSIKKKRSNVSSTKYHVTPEMLDDLSKESFPPCMKNIHENLRKNHHLRHYGRLHYGLFLKSIGLSLEDALNFFRQEFIQKVTPERFQKDYAYNIRYNYGKEGKKVSLSAYSCNKIINENAPQPGDTHGCPFRHFDAEHLKKFLKSCNISEQYIEEMLEDVKQKSYTKACSKYYQAKHNHPFPAEELYHPNQYYSESRKFFTVGLQLSDVSCGSEVSMQTEQNDTATEFYNNLECDEDVMHIDVSQVSELTKADSCGTSNEKDENEM